MAGAVEAFARFRAIRSGLGHFTSVTKPALQGAAAAGAPQAGNTMAARTMMTRVARVDLRIASSIAFTRKKSVHTKQTTFSLF